MPKVTVVGAGQVGSTTALRLADRGIADVVIVDVDGDLARGKALDIAQSLPLTSSSVEVLGGGDYGLAEGSDVAVVTAGYPREPGMSRGDLLEKNAMGGREGVLSLAGTAPGCGCVLG